MSVKLEDSQCQAVSLKASSIAIKLADMKAIQNLIIANDKILIESYADQEISNRLENFLRDDQKNLGIIDTVILQYGIKAEPNPTVQKEITAVEMMMKNADLTLLEKVAKQELLKHTQTILGLLVYKAAQVVGGYVLVAIAPLNAVNFENHVHQEQLKGMMESLSILELTGKTTDQGLWARMQDTIATFSSLASGLINHNDYDIGICDLIRLDRSKVHFLFGQILVMDDPQQLEEYFGDIYQDLCAHLETQEQVVYPVLSNYYNNIQKLYNEQAEIKQILEQIKSMNCFEDMKAFKAAVERLMSAVSAHVEGEEKDIFPRLENSCGEEQQKQMATEFKTAKSRIQEQRLAVFL